MRIGSGDGTKSLKPSGHPTCFAANNEGFASHVLSEGELKQHKLGS